MNTEQELIELIKSNQEKYYRVAFSYVKNNEDALDIVHDAIVKALQKVHGLRNRAYLETWFYRILINESISFIRKRKPVLYPDALPEAQLSAAEAVEPEEYMTLYAAIDHLSPKLKTVIILRFFEDMKFDEIAEITGAKLSTVKARVYKALKILKIDIEGIDYDG